MARFVIFWILTSGSLAATCLLILDHSLTHSPLFPIGLLTVVHLWVYSHSSALCYSLIGSSTHSLLRLLTFWLSGSLVHLFLLTHPFTHSCSCVDSCWLTSSLTPVHSKNTLLLTGSPHSLAVSWLIAYWFTRTHSFAYLVTHSYSVTAIPTI